MHLKCTSSLSHLYNLYFNNCNNCIVVNFVLHICTQSWSDANASSFKQVIPEGHLRDNELCLHNHGLEQIAAAFTVVCLQIHIFFLDQGLLLPNYSLGQLVKRRH